MAERSFAEHTDILQQVRAIKSNNEAALRQLYLDGYSNVEAFVLSNNGTSEQAKDIFQDAFIAVWRNIQMDRFQPRTGTALDGYLYQVAKNKWMDYLRSGHYNKVVRMENATLPDTGIDALQSVEHEHLETVKSQFKNLGDNCRKILTMFYYDNQSLLNISEAMGWTEATAKNNKYRCLQQLRELVNKKV